MKTLARHAATRDRRLLLSIIVAVGLAAGSLAYNLDFIQITGIFDLHEATRRHGLFAAVVFSAFALIMWLWHQNLVAQREATQSALQESEERYRRLFENAQDVIFRATATEPSRIEYVNPYAQVLTGYTCDELKASSDPVALLNISGAVQQEIALAITAGDLDRTFEFEITRKNRTVASVQMRMIVLPGTNGGAPFVEGTVRDVTAARAAVRAAQVADDRLRMALRAARQGLFDAQVQSGKVTLSREYAQMCGRPAHDWTIGIDEWFGLVHADDVTAVRSVYSDCITGAGTPIHAEFRLAVRPGEWRWFLSAGRVIELDPAGRPARIAGIVTDVTELHEVRSALHRSLNKINAIVDAAPVAVITIDARSEMVEMWNQGAEQIFGWCAAETIGRPLPVASFDERMVLKKRLAPLQEGASIVLEHARRLRKDGTYVDVSLRAAAVRSNSGEVTHIVLVYTDITEELAAQSRLRLLSSVVEQNPASIVIADPQGVFEYVNPAVCRMTGYAASELIGRTAEVFFAGDAPGDLEREIMRTVRAGGTWSGELTTRGKSGEIMQERAIIAPVTSEEGTLEHVVAVKQDITEVKELTSQLLQSQKMEAIGRLAGGIAHDFNNVLTVIIGNVDLGSSSACETGVAAEALEQIRGAAERARDLTRRLLAFSRQQPLHPDYHELNTIIDSMRPMLTRILGEDILVEWNLQPGRHAVFGDRVQFEQIIMNLVVNARDAMEKGGRLDIATREIVLDQAFARARPGAFSGPCVLLEISDNGCGMPPQVLERIFEPFFTTKPAGKGTGLGLATVFGIVRQSNAHIEVESGEGVGTTFRIYLPATIASAHASATLPPPEPVQCFTIPLGKRVLVVEDDETVLSILTRALEKKGCDVFAAESADAAQDVIVKDARSLDLLITDVVLPGCTGADLVRNLRRSGYEVPVIFTSGYAENQGAAVNLPPHNGFLNKPFTIGELQQIVGKVLSAA